MCTANKQTSADTKIEGGGEGGVISLYSNVLYEWRMCVDMWRRI